MVVILMGLLGIFLPIGAGFVIVGLQEGNIGTSRLLGLAGMICWGFAIYFWIELKKAYEKEEEKNNLEKLTAYRFTEAKFTELILEIKGLRQDLRGDKKWE